MFLIVGIFSHEVTLKDLKMKSDTYLMINIATGFPFNILQKF